MQKEVTFLYSSQVDRLRPTPKEELAKERRHARLTKYLQDHNLTIQDFLVWYKEQTNKSIINSAIDESPKQELSGTEDFIVQGANSADYALHNFAQMKDWKKK